MALPLGVVASSDVLHLYEIEANLVQEKVSHILTIRSLAVTVSAAVLGAALVYPEARSSYSCSF